jgi:phosphate transport system substrate-binding protein
MPENDAITKFIQDSVQFVFASRSLDTTEASYLTSKNKNGQSYMIAHDALAFIINENDNDTIYSQSDIKQAFILNRKNKKIVFNENNSSTLNYMNQYLRPASLTSEATATRNSEDLINYISQNKNSIGIIGSNFFSNLDDSTANIIYPKVKLVGINVDGQVYYPFQADISAQKYPYVRTIYVLNNEHYYGKYTGFKNFIVSPRGQRLILKSGLLPVKMPNRLLNFVKKREQ